MTSTRPQFLPIGPTSHRLGVPRAWLRREADAGRIPCLMVGRRRMFNLEAVRETLEHRSGAGLSVPQQEARS
ncbi:MAG: helix-turn-helix domain-containing protein [Phycisphaerales bacterium]|nr:helix-turn-helix domain-containing protein [Planctomycetota bacterium]MCH8507826.1 helix-turn-helix domain-containing protein [Phycisphaerales bacterium]